MTLGWLSDIHLDCLDEATRLTFLLELGSVPVDAWLLSGDIHTAPHLSASLELMEATTSRPIYFVLGNHDYYGGSVAGVRANVRNLVGHYKHLTWLTDSDPVKIDPHVTLVGDDGWADARWGDPIGSDIELSDFHLIEDLIGLDARGRIDTLNRLGDEAAARLAPKLHLAAQSSSLVVILTHVPPFREATWHHGQPCDDDGLPWFCSKAMGDVILDCAREHAGCEFLVLCGHTHGEGQCSPAWNVTVLTAGADYGAPRIQGLLEFKLGTWKRVG